MPAAFSTHSTAFIIDVDNIRNAADSVLESLWTGTQLCTQHRTLLCPFRRAACTHYIRSGHTVKLDFRIEFCVCVNVFLGSRKPTIIRTAERINEILEYFILFIDALLSLSLALAHTLSAYIFRFPSFTRTQNTFISVDPPSPSFLSH